MRLTRVDWHGSGLQCPSGAGCGSLGKGVNGGENGMMRWRGGENGTMRWSGGENGTMGWGEEERRREGEEG